MESKTFRVYLRVRPFKNSESPQKSILKVEGNSVFVNELKGLTLKDYTFSFEGVISNETNNYFTYKATLQNLIGNLAKGLNLTCFAYGTTGTGKSHTILGSSILDVAEPGVLFYALKDLFEALRASGSVFNVKVSYLEIYNEGVRDLLNQSTQHKSLNVVEDPVKGVLIPDSKEVQIESLEQAENLIGVGNELRIMASTLNNEFSTRSHAIIQVNVEQKFYDSAQLTEVYNSKLSMIDLAGSEKAMPSENKKIRTFEGSKINKSLLALGNCINILSDPKKKQSFVPYRDSKLTRLLKDSLGGNTVCVMIACVSPCISAIEETLNTMKYAQRATLIQKKVSQNKRTEESIEKLKLEVRCLKSQLLERNKPNYQAPSDPIEKQLQANFEEFWELKNALNEVERLNFHNKNNSVGRNSSQNEYLLAELNQKLHKNLEDRKDLEFRVSLIKDQTKKEVIELQTSLRTLKAEKLELQMQNSKIKQEAMQAQKEILHKNQLIEKMHKELKQIKSSVSPQMKLSNLKKARLQRKSVSKRAQPCFETINFINNYSTKKSRAASANLVKRNKELSQTSIQSDIEKLKTKLFSQIASLKKNKKPRTNRLNKKILSDREATEIVKNSFN